MKRNSYNKNSFEKGKDFEDFVEQKLFPDSYFVLLHKTNDYDQNNERYVENSKYPDFQFRSLVTGKEFHIEAKYRSKAYNNSYNILSDTQVETFSEIHDTQKPILIALGYGGKPNNPDFISLIPYKINQNKNVSISDVNEYKISKETVSSVVLENLFLENNQKAQAIESKAGNKKNYNKKKLAFILSIALIVILAIVAFNYNTNSEDEIKNRIKTYYTLYNAKKIDELKDYISPEMKTWYGIKNPSINDVLNNMKEYNLKYPNTHYKVDWSTFDVIEKDDGRYYATYSLFYKVNNEKNKTFRNYDFEVLSVWDEDLRLVSIKNIQ